MPISAPGHGQQQYAGLGAAQAGGLGELKQVIDVPKSVVGKIIGKGGETITLIQRKSNARVTVDQSVPEGMPCKVVRILVHNDFDAFTKLCNLT
jgi:predicted PilT family ATPase